jgi:hypothetical protein
MRRCPVLWLCYHGRMERCHTERLPVEKIIREFEESEAKPGHRKDAFKIDVPFDEALRRIAAAGPEPKSRSRIREKSA